MAPTEAVLQAQAQTWTTTYLEQTSPKDLCYLLNLIYFSYKRSVQTLRAQESVLHHLELSWQCWQNITQTRLDPSHELPYLLTPSQIARSAHLAAQDSNTHKKINSTYKKTVDLLVAKNILCDSNVIEAIKTLRSDSRTMVSIAVADTLQILINAIQDYTKKSIILPDDLLVDELTNGGCGERSIIDYLQSLAVPSFVTTDKEFSALSTQSWNILLNAQQASCTLWGEIEEGRALFYKTYYKELYTFIAHRQIDPLSMRIVFDEEGLINQEDQVDPLPTPELL